jgi:hypothetical protein
MRGRKRLSCLAIAIGALSWSTTAQADLRLALEDGAATGVVITDQGVGDSNPVVGADTFVGAIDANFMVNVTTGISKPVVGSNNEISLTSVNVASAGAGTIHIFMEDTGFTNPPSGAASILGTAGGTLTAPAGSKIEVQSWGNPGNGVPNYGPDTFPAGHVTIGGVPGGSVPVWSPAFVHGPGSFSNTSSAPLRVSGPYSLFAEVDVTFKGKGSVSFTETQTTSVVPEPSTFALAGLGALGLIGCGLRRRQALGA